MGQVNVETLTRRIAMLWAAAVLAGLGLSVAPPIRRPVGHPHRCPASRYPR